MSRKLNKINVRSSRHQILGVSLIELMIALVLGLLVVSAAIGIFISNRQVFRATDNLSYVQENARVAFEIMARELRQAGGNPCSRNIPMVNVLKNTSAWGTGWGDGVHGYDGTNGTAFPVVAAGTAAGSRVPGTDSIELRSGGSGEVSVEDHKPKSAQFKVNTVNHGLVDGDIVMVCDYVQAAIFQVTNASSTNVTIVHNTGATVTPGNCTNALGYPMGTPCNSPHNENYYAYGPNSIIAKLKATAWYIGVSSSDPQRKSLYQVQMTRNGTGVTQTPQEIAEGVADMQLQYLVSGGPEYRDANAITDWSQVSAVRVVLTVESTERVDVDGTPITRTVAHTVTLRNRNS